MNQNSLLTDDDIFMRYIELTGNKPPPITETTKQIILNKITELEKSKFPGKQATDSIANVDDDELFELNYFQNSPVKKLNFTKIDSPVKSKPVSALTDEHQEKITSYSPVKVTQLSLSQPVTHLKSPKKSLVKTASLSTPVKTGLFNSVDLDRDNNFTPPSPTVSISSSGSPQRAPPSTGTDGHRVRHLPEIHKPGHYRSFRRNSISRCNFDPYDDMMIVGPGESARCDAERIFSRVSQRFTPKATVSNETRLRLGLGFALLLVVGSALYYLWAFDPFYTNPMDKL